MSLRGKTVLIQGAGRGHLGLINTCKRLGITTIVTGLNGNYPCIPLADKFIECDIRDKEKILEIARDEKIDGIVICCSDTGLKTVGYVNDRLGLKGISEEAAILCSDKLRMKKQLVASGVNTAKYSRISSVEDLSRAQDKLSFPLILKATDLQGSRGIYRVDNPDELKAAYVKVCELTNNPYCVLEEFIVGQEFGAQAFVSDHKIIFILPHGDETILCGTNVPIGHYMPYKIGNILEADALKQVELAIKALGLNNCAVNIDLIAKDDKAYIIELTGRVGANCLPELTGNYFGIDYYEMILSCILGENPVKIFDSRGNGTATKAEMIKSNKKGRVKSIVIPDCDSQITMFINDGDEVREFSNSNDAIGQIISKGVTLDECANKIDAVLNQIKIEIQ